LALFLVFFPALGIVVAAAAVPERSEGMEVGQRTEPRKARPLFLEKSFLSEFSLENSGSSRSERRTPEFCPEIRSFFRTIN